MRYGDNSAALATTASAFACLSAVDWPQTAVVVERRRSESGRTWTYHLTAAGREFRPLIEALGTWGQRWSRRRLHTHEVNLTVLIRALELHTNAAAFGKRTCVVKLTFIDQPAATQNWWFLNEAGRLTVCFEDPGFEIALYLETTVPDMTSVDCTQPTQAR